LKGKPIVPSNLRVNFPPDPNPKKPRLKAPPGSWDTHFHVWGPPHLFPYTEKRRYTPPAAPVEHYLAVARVIGLERGVIVQPSAHGTDTRVTLDAIAKSSGRLRGMIRADAALTPAEVKRLHAGGVRGLRIALRHEHGNQFNAALFHQMVGLISPLNWALDLQIDDDAIAELSDLILKVPVPVIIDTFGDIDFDKGGLEQPAFKAMIALLETGRVWVKIHGANRFLARGVAYEDIVKMARAYLAVAPDRVIWGTDWPHSEIFEPGQMPNDGDLIDMLLDYAPDEASRKKILVDTPSALFDFD
jgi:predicted TIM-barrel fold metal-dependent hydrolase